jgi:hypothetical protein
MDFSRFSIWNSVTAWHCPVVTSCPKEVPHLYPGGKFFPCKRSDWSANAGHAQVTRLFSFFFFFQKEKLNSMLQSIPSEVHNYWKMYLLMAPEDSFPFSQKLAFGPYPEAVL